MMFRRARLPPPLGIIVILTCGRLRELQAVDRAIGIDRVLLMLVRLEEPTDRYGQLGLSSNSCTATCWLVCQWVQTVQMRDFVAPPDRDEEIYKAGLGTFEIPDVQAEHCAPFLRESYGQDCPDHRRMSFVDGYTVGSLYFLSEVCLLLRMHLNAHSKSPSLPGTDTQSRRTYDELSPKLV